MKTVQLKRHKDGDWEYLSAKRILIKPLVFVFGNRNLLEDANICKDVRAIFPDGHLIFGSTSGDITANAVDDDSITITAVQFNKSYFEIKTSNVLNSDLDSYKTCLLYTSPSPRDS